MITEILSAATSIFPLHELKPPITVSLQSTEVGRKIEFSVDGGSYYFSPTLDIEITEEIITHATIPITHIKATGKAGDILTVLFEMGD
jgi:hypothetical protein